MKIGEALGLNAAVNALMNNPVPKPNKLTWALQRNKRNLASIVEDFQTQLTAGEDAEVAKAYEDARMALIREYAIIDSEGNPVSNQGQYVFKDTTVYSNAYNDMMKANPSFITLLTDRETRATEITSETCDVAPYKVAFELLPDNLDPALLEALEPMLNDPVD